MVVMSDWNDCFVREELKERCQNMVVNIRARGGRKEKKEANYTEFGKALYEESGSVISDVLKGSVKVLKGLTFITLGTGLVLACVSPMVNVGGMGVALAAGAGGVVLDEAIPVVAEVAQANEGWDNLIQKVLWITDYLMDGVIIFSGISWMFGHRTKAIELLFSSGIGYVIIRHHKDIKEFFELL